MKRFNAKFIVCYYLDITDRYAWSLANYNIVRYLPIKMQIPFSVRSTSNIPVFTQKLSQSELHE